LLSAVSRLQAADSAAEAQRTKRHVLQVSTRRCAMLMRMAMVSSTLKMLTGSVLKTGADAKKALARVSAFRRTDLLMALACSAALDKLEADAEADVSRSYQRWATTIVARHFSSRAAPRTLTSSSRV
jgi:hypothetical protein